MKTALGPYAKAIVAGVVAFVGAGAVAAVDDSISPGEWWVMAATAAAALGATFGIPNTSSSDTGSDTGAVD